MHKEVMSAPKTGPKKRGETFKSFIMFLKSIKKYSGLIVLSVFLSIGSAVLGIFIPKILGDMTNIAINTYPEIDFNTIIKFFALTEGGLIEFRNRTKKETILKTASKLKKNI